MLYEVITDSVLTTYSIATNVRLSLYEAGFEIYEINPTGKRKQTLAFKSKVDIGAKYIDIQLKKQRNKDRITSYNVCYTKLLRWVWCCLTKSAKATIFYHMT